MRFTTPRWLFFWSMVGLAFSGGIILRTYMPDHGIYDITGYVIGRDFVNVWMASHLLAAGNIASAYDIHRYIAEMRQVLGAHFPFHNWSYPPTILPFLYPFSPLGYGPALALWSLLGLVLYCTATRLKNFPHDRLLPWLLLITSPAAIINLLSGQNGFFTAACFIGGFSILNRRPWLAGILFGLLTIKPQLGIAIPFALLALSQWRAIASATLTTALLIAISFTFWGLTPWHDYIANTLPYQQHLLDVFQGFYIAMMPGTFAAARLLGYSYNAAMCIHAAIAIAALALATTITRREGASPRAILALAIASILLTPYAYNYDLTAVAAALVLYLCATVEERAPVHILLGGLWILPTAIYTLMFDSLPFGPLLLVATLTWLTWQSFYPRRDRVRILPFTPERAPYFDQFNRDWITRFFWLEPFDETLLTQPRHSIIAPGGEIWFAEENGKVLGTCALIKSEDGIFEFSKLGLAPDAKGRGISRTLLHHCINRARHRGAHTLRIFTHSSLKTACDLYRAEGFRDVTIPEAERARYQRADTLLLFTL